MPCVLTACNLAKAGAFVAQNEPGRKRAGKSEGDEVAKGKKKHAKKVHNKERKTGVRKVSKKQRDINVIFLIVRIIRNVWMMSFVMNG